MVNVNIGYNSNSNNNDNNINHIGALRKMQATLCDSDPVQYNLVLQQLKPISINSSAINPSSLSSNPINPQPITSNAANPHSINLNQYLNKTITLKFLGTINCVACNRTITKTFNNGYCFVCFKKLAACDSCILKPELCHYHLGTCREPNWGEANCFIPHIVYLANSSELKVGITRETQLPTRWLDQGATQALPILRVQSRRQAGLIEVFLARQISDKTNWRKMLQGTAPPLDLLECKAQYNELIVTALQQKNLTESSILTMSASSMLTIIADCQVTTINYPVLEYPSKITALDLHKQKVITGKLIGIKGQYLIFDIGVLNVRKFTGYLVQLTA